ncbi:ion channel [Pseudoalteromonas tetraodonis]|uniref:ion channel n=1 Tax=Pseudoalteromonas tetraodonis TaxID=43659 RepID=UPI003CFD720F
MNNNLSFSKPLLNSVNAFYFSVVTQTTLGYGDIVPVSSVAKLLVSFHASFGVILLAIIAGLTISVGLEQRKLSRS